MIAGDDVRPPILLVLLGQGDLEHALTGRHRLDAPDRVALFDWLVEFTVDDQGLALEADLQMSLLDVDCQLLGGGAGRDGDIDGEFGQCLLPGVLVGTSAIT